MTDDTRQVCQKHEALEVSLTRIERATREGFERMNKTLSDIAKDLRDGAVEMATIRIRLAVVEKICFGAVALALTGLGAGVLALVLKGGS